MDRRTLTKSLVAIPLVGTFPIINDVAAASEKPVEISAEEDKGVYYHHELFLAEDNTMYHSVLVTSVTGYDYHRSESGNTYGSLNTLVTKEYTSDNPVKEYLHDGLCRNFLGNKRPDDSTKTWEQGYTEVIEIGLDGLCAKLGRQPEYYTGVFFWKYWNTGMEKKSFPVDGDVGLDEILNYWYSLENTR